MPRARDGFRSTVVAVTAMEQLPECVDRTCACGPVRIDRVRRLMPDDPSPRTRTVVGRRLANRNRGRFGRAWTGAGRARSRAQQPRPPQARTPFRSGRRTSGCPGSFTAHVDMIPTHSWRTDAGRATPGPNGQASSLGHDPHRAGHSGRTRRGYRPRRAAHDPRDPPSGPITTARGTAVARRNTTLIHDTKARH